MRTIAGIALVLSCLAPSLALAQGGGGDGSVGGGPDIVEVPAPPVPAPVVAAPVAPAPVVAPAVTPVVAPSGGGQTVQTPEPLALIAVAAGLLTAAIAARRRPVKD